ncbi:recombinase family protein [Paraburkholderia sp. UYCP14C]|uniref:recombinase family protein n=1 Tax=Paraburkholderia sp. UYCP14C TaxID=2511130 RepID=UPI001022931F|nr:recombinase family protein [Paraburkholderia sp. UYCP14C]RZF23759.1 recombinase family protein [Paraburkholderia sp. UYCP14C]
MPQLAGTSAASLAGRRAAQYVRMSTEFQQYSTENQKRVIAEFAVAQGLTVVATYEDAGKSGVSLKGRQALAQLLQDVQSPNRSFSVVLVYDVSRWGRFQDVDESAHYEYICRLAGVQVVYCAEPFGWDSSPTAALMKAIKRAMAGEYSRELSRKVFIGQCRLAELGFWQGSTPGYGLQRVLVASDGTVKGALRPSEHKNIKTDRTVVTPGEAHEVALVQRIYDWYVRQGLGCTRISERLNAFGMCNANGRPWTPQLVNSILSGEKYIGNNVYARTSKKLDADWHRNPASEWTRSVGAFPPLVDRATFKAAEQIRTRRTKYLSDEEVLSKLRDFVRSVEVVNAQEIDQTPSMPAARTYCARFGSMNVAYDRIGYAPHSYRRGPEDFHASRAALQRCIERTTEALSAQGHRVDLSMDRTTIQVDDELLITFTVRLIRHHDGRCPQWRVRWPAYFSPDFLVALPLDAALETPLDFYVFPRDSLAPGYDYLMTIRSRSTRSFQMFRYPDESILLELAARSHMEAYDGRKSSCSHLGYSGPADSSVESADPQQAPKTGDDGEHRGGGIEKADYREP